MGDSRLRAPEVPPSVGPPAGTLRGTMGPDHAGHQTSAGSGGGVQQSLDAGLAFGQAQGVLVGLTRCTLARAAEALLRTAAQLDVDPASISTLLVHRVTAPDDADDAEADAFVARLEEAALTADADGRLPATPDRATPQRAGHAEDRSAQRPVEDRSAALVAPALHIVPTLKSGRRGVIVKGELDIATVPLLDAAVDEARPPSTAQPATTPAGFFLDLADVTFLDAIGLRAMARIHARTRAWGEELHVAAPRAPGPRQLLRLAVARGWLDPLFAPGDPRGEPDSATCASWLAPASPG